MTLHHFLIFQTILLTIFLILTIVGISETGKERKASNKLEDDNRKLLKRLDRISEIMQEYKKTFERKHDPNDLP